MDEMTTPSTTDVIASRLRVAEFESPKPTIALARDESYMIPIKHTTIAAASSSCSTVL